MISGYAIMIFVLAQGDILKSQGETDNARFHLNSPPRLHPLSPYSSAFRVSGETGEWQLSYDWYL